MICSPITIKRNPKGGCHQSWRMTYDRTINKVDCVTRSQSPHSPPTTLSNAYKVGRAHRWRSVPCFYSRNESCWLSAGSLVGSIGNGEPQRLNATWVQHLKLGWDTFFLTEGQIGFLNNFIGLHWTHCWRYLIIIKKNVKRTRADLLPLYFHCNALMPGRSFKVGVWIIRL